MMGETKNAGGITPSSVSLNVLSLFGMALLAAGAVMLLFCCVTVYQIFTAPQDVALMKVILDYTKDAATVISGHLDGKEFKIEFSNGFGWIAFVVFMIIGVGTVIGALSAVITAGGIIMKLAYGQPLYARRSDNN
ncbi:MAG: hypothetical protein WC043_03765 [Pseudobdellovibrionaceae bacterium]